MRSWLAFTVLVALSGCDLYFGNDDPPVCAYGGEKGGAVWNPQYRDPFTATCIYQGGECGEGCGGCAYATGAPAQEMAYCESECTNLTAGSCQAMAGCYAAYINDGETDGPPSYGGCWATAPSGPVGGSCANLDAFECSRHDNCSLLYNENAATGTTLFAACVQEQPTACGGSACAPGYHCAQQCYGSDDGTTMDYCEDVCVADTSCAAALCAPGTICVESCELDSDGKLQCGPQCVPDSNDPGSCTGHVACDALPPACPSGTTAGIRDLCWSGYCIPNSACGPGDPGDCTGPVSCLTGQPACPTGTTAGIANGCWTGYCIPNSSCPGPACETLATESACVSRDDCTPVYDGTMCTCYPSGCTCETLTYERCEPAYMPL